MKHIREYNNWVSDVTDNVNINYGDKKQKLSDVVIDAIKFIEDNYDKIDGDINSTREEEVGFEEGLKFESIKIGKDNFHSDIPNMRFMYRGENDTLRGYEIDITDYDYQYLKKYLFKIYKMCRKKEQEQGVETYKLELQKIEDKKNKEREKKYNI